MAHFNIIDFDDSFTFNVAEYCSNDGEFSVNVIHYLELGHFFRWIKGEKERSVLVVGPGPGHPNEYQDDIRKIFDLLNHPFIFHLGICLGHQLWSQYLGAKIINELPAHGVPVDFQIPDWEDFRENERGKKTKVTRYNSLFADFSKVEDFELKEKQISLVYSEVGDKKLSMAMKFNGGISYQFHPEAVGTLCPKTFFEPAFRFLR